MPLVGPRKRSIATITFAIAVLIAIAAIVSACTGQPQMPPQPGNEQPPGFFPTTPVTDAGTSTQSLYGLTFVIAVIVFALVEGLLIFITLRFRRKPTDTELPPQTHGSNPLEILWTLVPTVVVMILFAAALITLNEKYDTSADSPTLTVDVTGFQWQWTFEYPDQHLKFTGSGLKGPNMALPINETVRIRLHASDVIHSFYVPQFLYKKDVVPGRVNEFDVKVTSAGTYGGQCAEFCGLNHANMQFTVQAMPRADFDAWVAQQQAAVPTPAPSAPSGAPTVQVTAVSITAGFTPNTLTAPANVPWVVQLTNADNGIPHDFSIKKANADGSDWLGDPDAQGGGTATYQPPPLQAGDYTFFCSIHPNMTGTLHVGP